MYKNSIKQKIDPQEDTQMLRNNDEQKEVVWNLMSSYVVKAVSDSELNFSYENSTTFVLSRA